MCRLLSWLPAWGIASSLLGCPWPIEQQAEVGWTIDVEGCAVGDVIVSSPAELEEIAGITCFKDWLLIENLETRYLTPETFDHVVSIHHFSLANLVPSGPPPVAEQWGCLSLKELTQLDILSTSDTNGLIELSVPGVSEMSALALENNPDLRVARFDTLEDVRVLTTRFCHSLEEFHAPKLRRVGDETSPLFSFYFKTSSLVELSLPALERVDGELVIDGVSDQTHGDGLVIDLPRLHTVTSRIEIRSSLLERISLPALKTHRDSLVLGSRNLPDLDDFGLEHAAHVDLSFWVTPDMTTTLPHLRTADSISMHSLHNIHRLYMPALEELGSLFLHDCHALREVDLPAIECLGSVSTLCSFVNNTYCLLPEELDDEVARSRENGCDTLVDICDPRDNSYHRYDEAACWAEVP